MKFSANNGHRNNDFFYYQNDQSHIRLAYNDFYYYENDLSQKRLDYNDFLYYVKKHIIGITNKDWLHKISYPICS